MGDYNAIGLLSDPRHNVAIDVVNRENGEEGIATLVIPQEIGG